MDIYTLLKLKRKEAPWKEALHEQMIQRKKCRERMQEKQRERERDLSLELLLSLYVGVCIILSNQKLQVVLCAALYIDICIMCSVVLHLNGHFFILNGEFQDNSFTDRKDSVWLVVILLDWLSCYSNSLLSFRHNDGFIQMWRDPVCTVLGTWCMRQKQWVIELNEFTQKQCCTLYW